MTAISRFIPLGSKLRKFQAYEWLVSIRGISCGTCLVPGDESKGSRASIGI